MSAMIPGSYQCQLSLSYCRGYFTFWTDLSNSFVVLDAYIWKELIQFKEDKFWLKSCVQYQLKFSLVHWVKLWYKEKKMEACPYTHNRWKYFSKALICLFTKALSTQILKKQITTILDLVCIFTDWNLRETSLKYVQKNPKLFLFRSVLFGLTLAICLGCSNAPL